MPSSPDLLEVPIVLPALGVPRAKMSAWFADIGDDVDKGDRLAEVSVAGATFDVSAPATGRLTVQHVAPKDELSPGQVLGIVLVTDPESLSE